MTKEETCDNCGKEEWEHPALNDDCAMKNATCKKFKPQNHSPRLGNLNKEPKDNRAFESTETSGSDDEPSRSERSLSDKILGGSELYDFLKVEDVKEFIRKLKDEIDVEINFNNLFLLNKDFKTKVRDMVNAFQDKLIELKIKIDKLAGDKLIDNHSPQESSTGNKEDEPENKEPEENHTTAECEKTSGSDTINENTLFPIREADGSDDICDNCGHKKGSHYGNKKTCRGTICEVQCKQFKPKNHSSRVNYLEDKEPEDEVTELLSMPSGSNDDESLSDKEVCEC